MGRIDDAIRAIVPPCELAMKETREMLDAKTKPRGSLGRLEELAIRIAGVRGTASIELPRPGLALFAADHGIALEGVSAYPQQVTVEMLRNFARGGAAANVLARHAGAELLVVDVGSRCDSPAPGVLDRRVAPGTRSFLHGPAMTSDELTRALDAGVDAVEELIRRGCDAIAVGEMGIGNTTAASAFAVAFTGVDSEVATGRGTGIDDETLRRKARVVKDACDVHLRDLPSAFDVLARLGGFELAAIAGAVIAGAARRLPVVIDGFPATASALAAVRLAPAAGAYLIAAHRSVEPGHGALLDALGLVPVLDLGLRLGEGTGALLAIPILAAAVRILREMASFKEAGVTDAGR